MNSKNEIGIASGIAAIFILVLLTGVGVYNSLNKVILRVDESAKPNVRLLLLEQVLANLATAESSVKSYNLTRDKSYLAPFYKSLISVHTQLQLLKNKNQTDNTYQQLTDSVELLVEVKYEILTEIIGLGNTEKVAEELQHIAWQAEQSSKQALDQLKLTEEKKQEDKPKFWQRIFKKKPKATQASKAKLAKPKPAPTQVLDKVRKDISRSVALVKREQIRQLKSLKAQELALLQLDKQVMWSIRWWVARMQYLERKRIIYDAAEVSELVQKNNNRIVVFSLTIILLLVVVGYTIVLYIKKNYETNLALNQAKNEAESLAKAKEAFLAGMSHEIRTPLNAIIGFTEQLYQEPLTKQQYLKVETIKNAGSHLLEVINEVLDYTKITAGKLVLNPVVFNPVAELNQVLSTLKPMAQNKGLSLWSEMSGDFWCLGDKVRFNQVLYNLIGNAIKFTEYGNVQVDVKSKLVNETLVSVNVTITDTGIGIDEQELKMVFNEFSQANTNIQERFGGTGLGLAICKRMVELQGGTLDISSKLGEGTIVNFCIQYTLSKAESKPLIHELKSTKMVLPAVHILVADDNLYNRELLKTILTKWGATVVEAIDGQQALNVLINNTVDLCLIDIRMPKLSGIELITKIRAMLNEGKRNVPILVLTATISNQERSELLANAVQGVLTKPFKELELYQQIVRVAPYLVINEREYNSDEPIYLSTQIGYNTDQLHQMGDDAFVREMLTVFEKTLSIGIKKIQTLLAENNLPALADVAHQLIPSCRHLEVNDLVQELKQLEHEASTGINHSNIAQRVTFIEQLAQQLLAQLKVDLEAK